MKEEISFQILSLTYRHCVSLNYLSLSYCTQFTSKGLQSIASGKGCRKLIHLDISGCTQVCCCYHGKLTMNVNVLLIAVTGGISLHWTRVSYTANIAVE